MTVGRCSWSDHIGSLLDIFRSGYNTPNITLDHLDGGETRILPPILF